MGANLCSFKKPTPRPLMDKCSLSERPVKHGYFKAEKKRRQLHPQEKIAAKARKLTLEEWLVASPGTKKDFIISEELHVCKQSSRIYPSGIDQAMGIAEVTCKPKDGFSMEKANEGRKEEMVLSSSLSRTQSGRVKKKVSFRMPEESDIFIFYSSSPEKFRR